MDKIKRLMILKVTLLAALVSTGFAIFGIKEMKLFFVLISCFNWFNLSFLYQVHRKLNEIDDNKVKVRDLYPEDK